MNNIRLQDIANSAGVSVATVSRLLRDPQVVSPKTRMAILETMDLLGYDRPEILQESIEQRVGIIIPELTNQIFAEIAHELNRQLAHRGGIAILSSQFPGAASEPALAEALVASGCRGIIFVSGRHADKGAEQNTYEHLQSRSIPFVTVNGPLPGIPSYNTNDSAAVELALNHLAAFGHRRVALINGQQRLYPAACKSKAFKALTEKPFFYEAREYNMHFTAESGAEAALRAASRGVTGLICASDNMAIGAISALRIAGYRIPEDISIIGFDGTATSSQLNPPLTTVRQAIQPICNHAVTSLLRILHGEEISTEPKFFNPELIVRKSSGPAREKTTDGEQ